MLKLAYVGGLGLMASPASRHLRAGGPAKVLRVHDRGSGGAHREAARDAWRDHGAALVPTIEETIGAGDVDGVVVCCGKNGDDLGVVAEVARRLAECGGQRFVLHLSTVSTDFVEAAAQYCSSLGVGYANYPLTGGPLGARRGGGHPQGMLILASGDRALYGVLEPTLEALGRPRFLGERAAAGAETKLIGQHMVFCGCTGITTAAALHAQCFADGQLGGAEQAAYFDFLNTGAGGTRQWEVALSKGVRDDVWDEGFMVRHAVVDAIYAAQLALDQGLPRFSFQPMLGIALAFAFLLREHPEVQLATHAIARELLPKRAAAFDAFLVEHGGLAEDAGDGLRQCVASLPPAIQDTVRLGLMPADFEVGGDQTSPPSSGRM